MKMIRFLFVVAALSSAASMSAQTCVWSTDQTGKIVETCGSVGIGTTAPDRDLQVINGATSARGIEVATVGGSTRKEVLLSIDNNYAYLDSYNFACCGFPLKIQVNGGNTLLNPAAGSVGVGVSAPSNRLHVFTGTNADGISVDGSASPAFNLRNNGAVKAYVGLATVTGAYSADAVANDLIIRSESNNILLGRGSGRATMALVGSNVGIGLTDMTTYIDQTTTDFRPSPTGTHLATYSATSEAVLNAMSLQDANGAHIGGLYFTRVGGQADAHYQIAAIQGRQSGTGALAGGDLWFFTKPTNNAAGADAARMVIKQSGHVVIGDPATTDTAILNVGGDINVTGNVNAKYQDVAEWVSSGADLDAATVVVLDPAHDDQVMPSSRSYDTTVAGVVSSRPGVLLGVGGEGKEKIATTGRVKVKVDATRAPIAIGDLLVTSDVTGMAMKSEPVEINGRKFHQPGTVIGKALQPLSGGRGEILVLLSLQ